MKTALKGAISLILMILLCAGCTHPADNSGVAPDAEQSRSAGELEKIDTDKDDYIAELISGTATIEVTDVFEGRYEEPLSFTLSEEETQELRGLLPKTTIVDKTGGSTAYYKLIFRTAHDEILDEWTIDASGRINTYYGRLTDNPDDPDAVDPGSVLDSWRTRMETAHDISYDAVFNRKPGTRYFDDLSQAKTADLSEITENNFEEGVEYHLSEDQMEQLRSLAGKIKLKNNTRHTDNDDLYYRISIYDDNAGELHTIDVEKDGTVSCNGWPIEGRELDSFISSLYESSGLSSKE